MKKDEVKHLIQGQTLCRIAFKGEKYPYVVPFQYVYVNGSLYFHFTNYGRKMKLLQTDNRVAVEIERYESDFSDYSFVVLAGELLPVTNAQERKRAIETMAEEAKKRLAPDFLVAHGLRKEDGWNALTPEKSLIIMKLAGMIQQTALKSR